MKQLTQYIIEKLKINKDVSDQITEPKFIKALDNIGEIDLSLIWPDDENLNLKEFPKTKTGHFIKSIYVLKGKLIATYYQGPDNLIDEIFKLEDLTEEQQKKIYNYMTES